MLLMIILLVPTSIPETFYRDNIIPRKQIWLRTRNTNLLRSFIILTNKGFSKPPENENL